jgi:hypothetical protein
LHVGNRRFSAERIGRIDKHSKSCSARQ